MGPMCAPPTGRLGLAVLFALVIAPCALSASGADGKQPVPTGGPGYNSSDPMEEGAGSAGGSAYVDVVRVQGLFRALDDGHGGSSSQDLGASWPQDRWLRALAGYVAVSRGQLRLENPHANSSYTSTAAIMAIEFPWVADPELCLLIDFMILNLGHDLDWAHPLLRPDRDQALRRLDAHFRPTSSGSVAAAGGRRAQGHGPDDSAEAISDDDSAGAAAEAGPAVHEAGPEYGRNAAEIAVDNMAAALAATTDDAGSAAFFSFDSSDSECLSMCFSYDSSDSECLGRSSSGSPCPLDPNDLAAELAPSAAIQSDPSAWEGMAEDRALGIVLDRAAPDVTLHSLLPVRGVPSDDDALSRAFGRTHGSLGRWACRVGRLAANPNHRYQPWVAHRSVVESACPGAARFLAEQAVDRAESAASESLEGVYRALNALQSHGADVRDARAPLYESSRIGGIASPCPRACNSPARGPASGHRLSRIRCPDPCT